MPMGAEGLGVEECGFQEALVSRVRNLNGVVLAAADGDDAQNGRNRHEFKEVFHNRYLPVVKGEV